MEQRQRLDFILTNIDHSTSASFWETVFVKIQGIYWNWNNDSLFFCCNFQNTILILSAEGKEKFFVF